MKIDPTMTDDALLKAIGERLARLRLARNLTQQQLAQEAGVGVRTVQRLESGLAATQLSGFVRVCRALGLLDRLEIFLPETVPSPMAQLQQQGRRRQRASGTKIAPTTPKKWTWGDPE